MKRQTKIVIIGCGFAGLTLAKKLSKLPLKILLVDQNNYHTFQPLLYQVATGGLEAENIVYPIRKIFRKQNQVFFRMAEVISVDPGSKCIETNIGKIEYDYLVLAHGSTNNFFSFQSVEKFLLPLKSLSDALQMRNRIMLNFERLVVTDDKTKQEGLMNFAIVGGGPAGLEIAGALSEMKKYVLPLDFPELDFSKMQIYLFDASDRILNTMSVEASEKAHKYLTQLGVIIKTGIKVTDIQGGKLILEDGSEFITETVIWAAGVKVNKLQGFPDSVFLPNGRIKVDEFHRVINTENVFALGDASAFVSEAEPHGLPMLAPVAIQQAKHLYKNFKLKMKGKDMQSFRYRNKGIMATVGRKRAVVDLPGWKFQGIFAWFVWMFIHLMSLIGFKNKFITLIQWSASYFNYDKPLGIIVNQKK